ncbi:MAG: hypothetical protein IPJ98_17345 [Bryobacterales bacterium]|nr:hypothetical protein [Bryobacterales bacterium]
MARRVAVLAVGFVLSWGCGGKKASPAGEQRAGQQAEYAAAGSCAECHAAQAKTHAETGMGRAFARATEASAGREFAGGGRVLSQGVGPLLSASAAGGPVLPEALAEGRGGRGDERDRV